MPRIRRPACARLALLGAAGAALLLATGCGGSGGGSSRDPVGALLAKPDGSGIFVVDPHLAGSGTRLHLLEITWGRLVDVYALDERGEIGAEPVLRDYVVNENVQSVAGRYALETNPITQATRLVILRPFPDLPGRPPGEETFAALLFAAERGLPGVLVKSDLPSESPPFSYVARNATLVLRFDDLLEDGQEARLDLTGTVRLLAGYPPEQPVEPRLLFDPNHGGFSAGVFHSTRVLVDLTVSQSETLGGSPPRPLNPLGLPRSDVSSERGSAALRLPTRLDPGTGQFALLRNLGGAPLDEDGNGPLDLARATRDVVRALRAGNEGDLDNGFLLDMIRPRLLGSFPIRILAARPLAGLDWSLDLEFVSACRKAPAPGDMLSVGEAFFEVRAPGPTPDAGGRVLDQIARVLTPAAVGGAAALLGAASYQTVHATGTEIPPACWVRITPLPGSPPDRGVDPSAAFSVLFSEPMDPVSVRPFDSLFCVRGARTTQVAATNLVVAAIEPAADLREFTLRPALPLAHDEGGALFHLRLPRAGGVTDLSGNELVGELAPVEFDLASGGAAQRNAGFVLRFDSSDELEPVGAPDLRGQFTYDLERSSLRARPVSFASDGIDRSVALVALMTPFGPGVQTPLTPLGSRLQMLWRYADLGWSIRDEGHYNLDVIGLSWSPARGQVVADYFEQFEIALAHSSRLPDEARTSAANGLPRHANSGLLSGPTPFAQNLLESPLARQKIVHERSLGYRVVPSDLFVGPEGTSLLPYPLNRGAALGALRSYTWRDTAVTEVGGPDGRGVPLDIEAGPPLGLEDAYGTFAPSGQVPSVGLPLLIEIRCFPGQSALGLNPLAILLASNTSARPNFRAYSSGGIDLLGHVVNKNPDFEFAPTGGFNPGSRPPGKPTRQTADNSVYVGQLDYVTRVSRAHSIWIDTQVSAPRYAAALLEPSAELLPPGTSVALDFRGADGFQGAGELPFSALTLTPYGDIASGTILFHGGDGGWKSELSAVDGARYLQLRITFLNNIVAGLSPELSALGIAFEIP